METEPINLSKLSFIPKYAFEPERNGLDSVYPPYMLMSLLKILIIFDSGMTWYDPPKPSITVRKGT
ncbi:hypothetical protein D3C78_1563170 [compost metagenome]